MKLCKISLIMQNLHCKIDFLFFIIQFLLNYAKFVLGKYFFKQKLVTKKVVSRFFSFFVFQKNTFLNNIYLFQTQNTFLCNIYY